MMAERGDFMMVHEPFSYLAEFGQTEVAGERVTSTAGLISVLTSLGRDGRVFAKETTGRHYPEVLADRQFLAAGAQHTFLIRHPRETIASYRAIDPGAARTGTGCWPARSGGYADPAGISGARPGGSRADAAGISGICPGGSRGEQALGCEQGDDLADGGYPGTGPG